MRFPRRWPGKRLYRYCTQVTRLGNGGVIGFGECIECWHNTNSHAGRYQATYGDQSQIHIFLAKSCRKHKFKRVVITEKLTFQEDQFSVSSGSAEGSGQRSTDLWRWSKYSACSGVMLANLTFFTSGAVLDCEFWSGSEAKLCDIVEW